MMLKWSLAALSVLFLLLTIAPAAAQDVTPTETPTPTASAAPTLTPTDPPTPPPTLTETPTATATQTETATALPTAALTETPTATFEATASPTANPTLPSSLPTATPSIAPAAPALQTNGAFLSASSYSTVIHRNAADGPNLNTVIQEANNGGARYVINLTGTDYIISSRITITSVADVIIVRDSSLFQATIHATTSNNGLFFIQANAKVVLINVRIQDYGNTGGVTGAVYNNGQLLIHKSTFYHNNSQDGGAVANFGGLQIWNSTFQENNAQGGGGALANLDSDSTISIACTYFQNNQADYAGGISGFNGSGVTVQNSNFSGNLARRENIYGLSDAIYNNPAHTDINATDNWWNSINGPEAAGNPSTGDSVSARVTYSPYQSSIVDTQSPTLCPDPPDVAIPPATATATPTPTLTPFATNTPQPTTAATATLSPATATVQAAVNLAVVFPAPMNVAEPRLSSGNADSHLASQYLPLSLCSRDMNPKMVVGGNYPIIASAAGSVIIIDTATTSDNNNNLGNFVAIRLPFPTLPIEIQNLLLQMYPNIQNGHTQALAQNKADYLHIAYGHLASPILVVEEQPLSKVLPTIANSGKTGLEYDPALTEHLDTSVYYVSNTGQENPDPKGLTVIDSSQRYFNIFINTLLPGNLPRYGLTQAIDPLLIWPILKVDYTGTISSC